MRPAFPLTAGPSDALMKAVAVRVEEGRAAARGLEQVPVAFFAAVDGLRAQARLARDIDELHVRGDAGEQLVEREHARGPAERLYERAAIGPGHLLSSSILLDEALMSHGGMLIPEVLAERFQTGTYCLLPMAISHVNVLSTR